MQPLHPDQAVYVAMGDYHAASATFSRTAIKALLLLPPAVTGSP